MLATQSHRCSLLLVNHKCITPAFKPLVSLRLAQAHSSTSSLHDRPAAAMGRPVAPNLVDTFQSNMNWFNQQYDRMFGIAEIRDIQTKVLEAESDFVSITQRRKSCQEQIEKFKEEIKSIRDKLDITARQSDNYLRLITEEHKLLREQLAMDAQLEQVKESEQRALDTLSRLLRQSHELERLRQERSKYWQIISISISLAGSLVALIAQRARSQKSVMNRLTSIDEKFLGLEDTLACQKLELDVIAGQMERLDGRLARLTDILDRRPETHHKEQNQTGQSWTSWLGSWVPGRSTFKSMAGYLW